jgi:hypothetical protein
MRLFWGEQRASMVAERREGSHDNAAGGATAQTHPQVAGDGALLPPGRTSLRHDELVKALEGDKGHISQSLRPLASKDWSVIDRTSSGRAASLALTPEGLEKAVES